jgi:dTDP-4-dehydrorhamnose reductase
VSTILLTGANGQVGFELAHWLRPHGRVVAIDSDTLDLADPDAIVRTMRELAPALVVNAAAYTAVDQAEQERDAAFAVNAVAAGVLAEEAKRAGSVLVHYSTDYVFDGAARTPYTEDAPTAPLSVYGASKLEGEQRIAASGADALVLRTSWVYGLRGRNFLLTIRRLAAEREELRIVADQTGVPNWCRTLAQATVRIVAGGLSAMRERAGLYHLSSGGPTTWYEFARAIVGDAPRPRVTPIATADYPLPARRPAYGVLATAKFERTFGFALPGWRDALAGCVASPADPARDVV